MIDILEFVFQGFLIFSGVVIILGMITSLCVSGMKTLVLSVILMKWKFNESTEEKIETIDIKLKAVFKIDGEVIESQTFTLKEYMFEWGFEFNFDNGEMLPKNDVEKNDIIGFKII